jgi:hypothetical protein
MTALRALNDRLRPGMILAIPLLIFLPVALGLHVVEDDYHYYERIARNIVQGAGSTYDGVVATNGYQPLWLMFECLAIWLERLTHIAAQYWALVICSLLSICVPLQLGLQAKSGLFRTAVLVALVAYLAFFGAMAMEASLLLVCGAFFFRHVRAANLTLTSAAGWMLALCFLSRIDSLVYFGPLVTYFWLRTPGERKFTAIIPLVFTIAVYVALNYWLFGVPVPISGLAKTVVKVTTMHSATWTFLVQGRQDRLMLGATILLSIWAAVAGNARVRMLVCVSAASVAAYYAVTSLRSDWTVLQWYEYPFALHLMALVLVDIPETELLGARRWIAYAATASAVVALTLIGIRNVAQGERQTTMYATAQAIKKFLADKPYAVVAMGDRAGYVGSALPNRVIQLEGLVMDRQFLETMRQATSLRPVLDHYGVNYYITTNPIAYGASCYLTWEPAQSKGDSVRVRNDICDKIVFEYLRDGFRTVVFEVRPPPQA